MSAISVASRWCAVSALTALCVACAAAVALDALAPGAGPLVQPLSSLAHTDCAWLWLVTVAAGTGGLLALAGALRRQTRSWAFLIGLTTAGIGLGLAGSCPADPWFPWERSPSLGGGVHCGAVGIVLIGLSTAIALRSRSLTMNRAGLWCRAAEGLYWGSMAGAAVYLGVTACAGRPPLLFGLWERLVLGSALVWSGLLAVDALGLHSADPTRL